MNNVYEYVLNNTQLNSFLNSSEYFNTSYINPFFINFNVNYNLYDFLILQENYDYFYTFLFKDLLLSNDLQLLISLILDIYLTSNIYNNSYNNDWLKNIFFSKENSIIFIEHPELIFIKNEINLTFNKYLSNLNLFNMNLFISENFYLIYNYIFNILFFLLLIIFIIVFYFSFYDSFYKNDSLIDIDFFLSNLTTESEEEIASIDDSKNAFLFFSFIFFWYFAINSFFTFFKIPNDVYLNLFFPYIYYFIFTIPFYLSYSFGLFLPVYLRGSGSSKILFVEVIYDYLAIFAFFIRLFVQNVRLILMSFTFYSLHELLSEISFYKFFLIFNENLNNINNVNFDENNNSYSFFFKFIFDMIHIIYEVLHTFFVVTSQFFAFFAMVFWLFLFLYTMFSVDKQEKLFFFKRNNFKLTFNKQYYNYKNNFNY